MSTSATTIDTAITDRLRRDPAALLDALRQAGADTSNPRKMLCPFHNEQHASAGIYAGDADVQRFKCHGCGAGGDVFDVRARVSGRSVEDELRDARSAAADTGHSAAPQPKRKPRPSVDWPAIHAQARAEIVPGELYDFADVELGLSGESMDILDVGVLDDRYVFPERDAEGNIIGLVRREIDGRKLSLPGSRRGLTYQHPFLDDDPVLVVEGASDTAAAIEAGFTAVGRPSNTGGGALLAELLRGRTVIVFGENDQKDNGAWPGRDGAESIAAQLLPVCESVRILFPPAGVKDLRGWLRGAK